METDDKNHQDNPISDDQSNGQSDGHQDDHNYREYQQSYEQRKDYGNEGGCMRALFTGFGIFAIVVFFLFGACFMAWR